MPSLGLHQTFGQDRALAIVSPANLFRLEWIKQHVGMVFTRLDCIVPRDLDHLADVVKRSREVHKVVLTIGGDGTLNRVIQHLDLEDQVVGLLPFGTGNDLARTLRIPSSPSAAIRWLSRTNPIPTDLMLICGVRAHNSAGFGLDAATLQVRDRSLGLAHSNYMVAFLKAISRIKSRRMKIVYPGGVAEGDYAWVLGMNSPYIGKGTRMAPRACIDDGLIDLVLLEKLSPLEMIALMPKAMRGTHLGQPKVKYEQVERVTCLVEGKIDYIAADGELYYVLKSEIDIKSLPGAMKLLR